MAIDYIKEEKIGVYDAASGGKKLIELLWGDRVSVLTASGSRRKVKARGVTGYVDADALGGESLLELYFIDVGQGDGVLIRTPDHRHILVDGGFRRKGQPTNKNAADFVDWKFRKDYGKTKISLDAMIISHCDADHYGGLWDLLSNDPAAKAELDCSSVEIGAFYHAGVGWWQKPGGGRWLGPSKTDSSGDNFLTQLMEDRASAGAALAGGAGPKLQGQWAEFIQSVHDTGAPMQRLSHLDEYVPGFTPADSDVALRVLAPVEFELDGKSALRNLGNDSQNTNGNSIMLRVDYGQARIMLTGDLNANAQDGLLEDYAGSRVELLCDVAKACHHGSEDVSFEFLQALYPACTIISSGDSEGHGHPRPSIVAASGITGFKEITNDRVVTPLVYSTEIARSIQLGRITKITAPEFSLSDGSKEDVELNAASHLAMIEYEKTEAGALQPQTRDRPLKGSYTVAGVVYGLVNVRTDGKKILCATRDETSATFAVKTFNSRF
jgi:beta-lactamase superfamily II metal-dependent hydrolase